METEILRIIRCELKIYLSVIRSGATHSAGSFPSSGIDSPPRNFSKCYKHKSPTAI
ncbi:hypothetical protein RMSM_01310 [Rhodopirellula maiorica SM1]|uniref:Uncharacterized protein n=1 Tax=Rhodopirellula maiorica SM1 TaxID=1265738 RepID=M5RR31_9BACT|nr:hypothetical protein RMSM_01310 [Rhodopirellula maiorica SM1]